MATLLITTTSLASGTQGTAYSATLAATGGTAPYTWSVLNGSLPAGLTLNASTGAITGTPTSNGVSRFTIEVVDSASDSSTAALSLAIATTYSSSKAGIAMGTVVQIGPVVGTGSPSYTSIAEITAVEFSGAKRDVVFTTNMSSGGNKEKLDTLVDWGNCKLTMNRLSNDPGQMQLLSSFAAGGKYLWKVALPIDSEIGQTTIGDLLTFAAVISDGPSFALDPEKVVQTSYTLDISGAITLTEGS